MERNTDKLHFCAAIELSCTETYLDFMPLKQTGDMKVQFLRQQGLKAFITPSKAADDDNVCIFKSNVKPNEATTPPNIKLEPPTSQAKINTGIASKTSSTNKNNNFESGSCTYSAIELCDGNIKVFVELKAQPREPVANKWKNCNN